MRSYGWTTSGEIVVDEAAIVRQVADRLDDGEPLRAVARWLNETGVVTVRGKQWAPLTVKRMVTSPRMVGDIDGSPAILDRAQWERIRGVLTDPERAKFTHRGGVESWVSGVVRCGQPGCGAAMYVHGLDLKCSCRRMSIRRELVESDCEARVVARLSDKKVRRAMARRAADPDGARDQVVDAEHRSQVLAAEYGSGVLSEQTFTAGVRAAHASKIEAEGRLREAELVVDLPDVEEVVDWWEGLPTDRRREVVEVLLDDIVVAPKAPGQDRLTYTWR